MMKTTGPTKHAVLSPSSAHRWMPCPGSVTLEKDIPSVGSKYSDEGTVAHDLAAQALLAKGLMPACPDREMGKAVGNYVEAVLRAAHGHTLLVEQALNLQPVTGEEDAQGTADAVIISSNGKNLQIHDLKYGKGVEVYAEDNPQLMIYGLAALEQYKEFGDFETVTLVIHQVRLTDLPDEWTIQVKDLLAFGEKVRAAALAAINPLYEVWTDEKRIRHPAEFSLKNLNPGDKQCRFCRAKATCPALAASVQDTVRGVEVSFDDFVDQPQAIVTQQRMASVADAEKLARLLPLVPLIKAWCKGVEERALAVLMSSEQIPGYKLVEGKRGNREWGDDNAVEGIMKGMRLNQDEMYSMKLISVAQAEKLLKDVNPKRWARLQEYVERNDGKPIIAEESDKRPALVIDNSNLFNGMAVED